MDATKEPLLSIEMRIPAPRKTIAFAVLCLKKFLTARTGVLFLFAAAQEARNRGLIS